MGLSLRNATMGDAMDIMKWRNDEQSRQNSFNKDIIRIPEHLEWYKKRMGDENCHLFILEDDNVSAGYIRIDCDRDFGEISYIIAPEKRGQGLGKEILALLEKKLPEGVNGLIGFTLPGNEGSRKCFEYNEYSEFTAGDVICFVKRIR